MCRHVVFRVQIGVTQSLALQNPRVQKRVQTVKHVDPRGAENPINSVRQLLLCQSDRWDGNTLVFHLDGRFFLLHLLH